MMHYLKTKMIFLVELQKSKFPDIVNQASDDLVKDQFDVIFEKFAIMEVMLQEHYLA